MPLLHDVTEMLLVGLIDLVDQQQHRDLHLPDLFQEVEILFRILHHVSDIEQDVGICQGRLRECQHHLLHLIIRFQHTGRVREDNLHVGLIDDAHNAVPRRLRLKRGDADLLTDKLIHQRGLTNIGVSYDIYKTGLMHKYF